MTSIDELTTPTNSLKAADLDGSEVTLTVTGYVVKEFEQTGKNGSTYTAKKPVISFAGTEKTLVCNKTNMGAIAYAYGKEMDNWIGKPITLYPTMVSFGTEMVEAIRVRVVKPGKNRPKFIQSDGQEPLGDMSDDIPF